MARPRLVMIARLITLSWRLMKNPDRFSLLAVFGIALLACSSQAKAVTECHVTPKNFFIGDGILWVDWVEGGTGVITQSDQDFNATLAVVSLAITNQKPLVERYAADGAVCSAKNDITGIWISR